jgi:hypothetical protein
MRFHPLWTYPLPAPPGGLVFERERGSVLAWCRNDWLYVLDAHGQCQAQRQLAGLAAASAADDGAAYVAVGKDGRIWWLAPDLGTRWEKLLAQPLVAVAVDPFGQYLATSDIQGGLHVFDCTGGQVMHTQSPRPLHHLAFVPAAPLLVGAADYAVAAAFDLTGKLIWRVGLVAHVGALAVSGAGEEVALACFSEGMLRYNLSGQATGRIKTPEPCRLVGVSFTGERFLAGTLGTQLLLQDREGHTLARHELPQPPAALALGPLGREAVVAVNDGAVAKLEIRGS